MEMKGIRHQVYGLGLKREGTELEHDGTVNPEAVEAFRLACDPPRARTIFPLNEPNRSKDARTQSQEDMGIP
jgi:hypothetical protein